MPRVPIQQFLRLAEGHPVFDVRSPGEYAHAHIPGAHTLPLFTDEERAIIGTAYTQRSQQEAIKHGLDFFGPRMRSMVEAVEEKAGVGPRVAGGKSPDAPMDKPIRKPIVLVHCWRGGMRSGAVSWLLELYGFEVYTLDGGYKAYRAWVLQTVAESRPYRVLGGYTGSGKTAVLHALKSRGEKVLDLEGIAVHRGSAFGEWKGRPQPGQEQFENNLAHALLSLDSTDLDGPIWVEDESQRIGLVNLPGAFWQRLHAAPGYFIDVPFEERLSYLVQEYGPLHQEQLVNAILRIEKRLGPLETKTAIAALIEGDVRGCFSILLKYYDKHYSKALKAKPGAPSSFHNIPLPTVDATAAADALLR